MEDFTYTLNTDKEGTTIEVSTELAEPDRVYVCLMIGQMSATAGLTLEQAQELAYALKQAFTPNDSLNEYHIDDLDEIDAFLERDET